MLIGAHWHQVMTYMEYTKWTHWKGIYKPNYLGFAAVSCKRRRRPCVYPLCSMEPICQPLKYDEHVSSFVLELQPITGSSPEKEMYCAPFTVTCFICGPTDLASPSQRCRTQLWANKALQRPPNSPALQTEHKSGTVCRLCLLLQPPSLFL